MYEIFLDLKPLVPGVGDAFVDAAGLRDQSPPFGAFPSLAQGQSPKPAIDVSIVKFDDTV